MKQKRWKHLVGALIWLFSGFEAAAENETTSFTFKERERIEELTGAKGKFDEKENVFKVSFPRSDLQVMVAGVKMTPPMGLTTWAAFKKVGDHFMVMGDNVLTEEQVNIVMSEALQNGLEVTALHNHFFWDSPKVMFMHIGGMGDLEKLATAVGQVFAVTHETSLRPISVKSIPLNPAKTTLDPKKIEAVMGVSGEMNNGVYKITIGKTTKMDGMEIGNAMGVNTWAAFVGGDEQAVVAGDFAMYEEELQKVLKTLQDARIQIVAIHNHMTLESPRVIFLHYLGRWLHHRIG